jgi:hypothetical protein
MNTNYKSVGEWKLAVEKEGFTVPLPLCRALSKIMEVRELSFPQSYKLLQDEDAIIISGHCFIYHMAADKLWMGDGQIEKQEERYIKEKEMKCVFFSLVVRNQAIEKKYQGGLMAFLKKHIGSEYNDDITTICALSGGDLDEPLKDLQENGFDDEVDYCCFDATSHMILGNSDNQNYESPVDWLEGRYFENSVKVKLK